MDLTLEHLEEISLEQAAGALNVSVGYLECLVAEGILPVADVNRRPHLRVGDVLAYKRDRDARRRARLEELTRVTEEVGGYDAELAAVEAADDESRD